MQISRDLFGQSFWKQFLFSKFKTQKICLAMSLLFVMKAYTPQSVVRVEKGQHILLVFVFFNLCSWVLSTLLQTTTIPAFTGASCIFKNNLKTTIIKQVILSNNSTKIT